ncbi:MAG: vitamin B12 dependent-methionine synthase activation domain-containing protein [Cyclobacteriaceae bacterium]|nr:vitamin B12 dependent-methionine synthase activation domain-containing protein [Cyclobacteriaceae bacterium]
MELQEYRYRFDDLDISAGIIEKFMGYEPGHSPEPIPDLIHEVFTVAHDHCDIRGGYVIKDDINLLKDEQLLHINGVEFDIKRIISGQLRKIDQIALFACTAGQGIGDFSKQLMHEGDFVKGYIVDVVGSEIVESAMDKIQDDLEQQMESTGLHITDRYSPGYCGWSVGEQHKLFSFFPRGFCGITLTPSSLMEPIKSVSGIIGIGENVRRKGYVCNMCEMVNCIYREKKQPKKADRC